MNAFSSPYIDPQYPESFGSSVLSIALIGPDEHRLQVAASARSACHGGVVRELPTYPASLDEVPGLLEEHFDVIIIGLDANPEYALELVENICAQSATTVMVYSSKADPDLLVRCMRAGARELLTPPFAHGPMAEALIRAAARRPAASAAATPEKKKTRGRLHAFLAAKGGSGVTTVACNFAVALAQESGQRTLLIDLDLPLGDAALNLGIVSEYSTIDALQDASRLDSSFLAKLLVRHSSGVYVLAAPGKYPRFQASAEAIDKLLEVARQNFENVVVDVGSGLDVSGTLLFRDAFRIYLVTQAGIPELRNSNRMIAQFFSSGGPTLEIVVNRYDPRSLGISDEQVTKALTRPANWKIPNDYAAVRQMQNTATPFALADAPISRLIRQMAQSVCDTPAAPPQNKKKNGFRFFK